MDNASRPLGLLITFLLMPMAMAQEPVEPANGAVEAVPAECQYTPLEDYNMAMHIAAIFIILGVSLLGTGIPVCFCCCLLFVCLICIYV